MENKLLPHGEKFLFVDEVVEANKYEIIGNYTFKKAHNVFLYFPELITVPSFFVLESLFQCGGAGARQLKICDGLFGIAKINSANFFGLIDFDQQINMKIQNQQLSRKIIKQSGKGFLNDRLMVQAEWVSINLTA
ncbi:MAG: beta-hydroxyacyl-ACP dehydratase [Cyclobacteriaceae bacterium]|jgi:3-hydroxyacyl-[acyl-carrier-protein] dehydratase|nr:beta-hydroxyacyl-ACP dehydratase [Cyclobacteriaceae bacterium]